MYTKLNKNQYKKTNIWAQVYEMYTNLLKYLFYKL